MHAQASLLCLGMSHQHGGVIEPFFVEMFQISIVNFNFWYLDKTNEHIIFYVLKGLDRAIALK